MSQLSGVGAISMTCLRRQKGANAFDVAKRRRVLLEDIAAKALLSYFRFSSRHKLIRTSLVLCMEGSEEEGQI